MGKLLSNATIPFWSWFKQLICSFSNKNLTTFDRFSASEGETELPSLQVQGWLDEFSYTNKHFMCLIKSSNEMRHERLSQSIKPLPFERGFFYPQGLDLAHSLGTIAAFWVFSSATWQQSGRGFQAVF